MEDTQAFAQLVVIGSSAGGVEALSSLVRTLPANFSAPIVIAQHIDPARPSHLTEILGRRATLPVHTVEDETLLEPGVIYVIPSNRHVEIVDGSVRVRSQNGGPRPSVDRLLTSAARVYGERLIAVILTGIGSDGAVGAREVNAAGGTMIIQNPDTASFPGMPLSLAPSTVDIVADLENIGPILHDLLAGTRVVTHPTEERTLRTLLDQLRSRSGIDFSSYKVPTIMRRLQRRMVATGCERLTDYVRYLGTHPDEYQRLVSSFLIKVTEFFRDPELFTYLRERIVPELIEGARQHGNELRFWSAGCATGEEAYSLAILVTDLLGDDLPQFNIRIFATDLDNEAITFARRGIYPAAALAALPADLIERYFTRVNGEYEIQKRVRALTIFGQHDLGQRAPFPHTDLVLCRNVLIYFTADLQMRALQLFAFSLRDGGYLALGKAETTDPLAEYFVVDEPHLNIYHRQGERTIFPPGRYRDIPMALPLRITGNPRVPVNPEQARMQREIQRVRAARERFESLLPGLPLGVVVVDRRYDIQAINNMARQIFGIHGEAIGEDFLHLIQSVPPAPIRAAIDAAFRGEAPVGGEEIATTEMVTGGVRYLELACHPQKLGDGNEIVDSVLISVYDVTEKTLERRNLEEELTRQRVETERLTTLMKRLAEMNRQLLEANQNLTNSNMELRSTNEEFLVANEEAQAATEEVETLNEEMQATNEELETLNEELQATVEELNTTNDDLEARSNELQESAVLLDAQRRESERERERLRTILSSIGDAVLVVDRAGRTMLANARYEEFFGDTASAFVPERDDGQPLPREESPQQRTARGEAFSMEFTTTVPDGSRRRFEATGRPIRVEETDAGVVVIRDITERSLSRLQGEFLAIAGHELRTPLTGLSGYLQMLMRDLTHGNADERMQQHAARAWEQAQRLVTLVNELLDATRLQNGGLSLTLVPLDLAALVSRIIETAQMLTETQTIATEIADGPINVQGDNQRLEQVLMNLLSNAITHAPGSARIDVRLRRLGGDAELQVQDYGPGITSDALPNIFTRFYRVEQSVRPSGQGLGLGLYIAHQIVLAHGGTIDVRSTLGEGTTFIVRLSLTESSPD